jgi:hypothetical protein
MSHFVGSGAWHGTNSATVAHVSETGERVTRRSDTLGAKLFLTFAGGQTAQTQVVTAPLASAYVQNPNEDELDDAVAQRNAYRAAVYEHQSHNSVTARAGLLLQNAGETTAEDLLIEISVPEELELAFVEQEPPPKSVRKTPIVPLEPSPRSWRSDSETRAHCRVVRVTSSVGLPQLFLTLRDRKQAGKFALDLKVTAARPALEQVSQLTIEFVQAERVG